MPTPDRPNETVLSPWKGRAKVLEIKERWRLFCDAQVRRLNSPDPVADPRVGPAPEGAPAREAAGAGDELTAVLPEGGTVVIGSSGGPGAERGKGFDAQV